MSTEKPLKVQVAEAIGWTNINTVDGISVGFDGLNVKEIPAYGETFCATGPLIVHYNICLGPEFTVGDKNELIFANKWGAKIATDRTGETISYAPSACEAIALTVIAAFSRGELQKV